MTMPLNSVVAQGGQMGDGMKGASATSAMNYWVNSKFDQIMIKLSEDGRDRLTKGHSLIKNFNDFTCIN